MPIPQVKIKQNACRMLLAYRKHLKILSSQSLLFLLFPFIDSSYAFYNNALPPISCEMEHFRQTFQMFENSFNVLKMSLLIYSLNKQLCTTYCVRQVLSTSDSKKNTISGLHTLLVISFLPQLYLAISWSARAPYFHGKIDLPVFPLNNFPFIYVAFIPFPISLYLALLNNYPLDMSLIYSLELGFAF